MALFWEGGPFGADRGPLQARAHSWLYRGAMCLVLHSLAPPMDEKARGRGAGAGGGSRRTLHSPGDRDVKIGTVTGMLNGTGTRGLSKKSADSANRPIGLIGLIGPYRALSIDRIMILVQREPQLVYSPHSHSLQLRLGTSISYLSLCSCPIYQCPG